MAPDFEANVPGFDSLNRAYLRERSFDLHEISGGLTRLRFGAWDEEAFEPAIRAELGWWPGDICYRYGAGEYNAQIIFDRNDVAYTVVHAQQCGYENPTFDLFLLYSTDFGTTWDAKVLAHDAADIAFALERPYSPEALQGPPAVLLWTGIGKYSGCPGGYGELKLVKPVWQQQTLTLLPEVVVTDKAMYIGSHSGGGTQVLTHGSHVLVAWGESVEPEEEPTDGGPSCIGSGSPVHVTEYDIGSSALAFMQDSQLPAGSGSLPHNDSHNRSALVMDTFDRLHVIVGSHNCSFRYLVSAEGDYTSWSAPVPTVTGTQLNPTTACNETNGGNQTYAAFVRDRDDRLHIVYREYQNETEANGRAYYLAYQRKDPGAVYWEDPDILVYPPHEWYSIYYHQLTIDHYGHLYLALSYYTTKTTSPVYQWFLDPENGIYQFSTMMTSDNGGASWQWASREKFDAATMWMPDSGAIGDIDDDSLDDVVHVYWDHGLNVHIDGSTQNAGVWQGWKSHGRRLTDGPGVQQFPVLVGDVNGDVDGRDDIVFVYRHWSSPYQLVLRTHFAQPDGTFSGVTSDQTDPSGIPDPAYRPLIGDVNGDQRADVVLMWRQGDCLYVRTKRSNGDGTWSNATTCLSDGTKVHQYPTRLGDVTGDGFADLVFVYRQGGFLYTRVKLGNANGYFSNGPQQQHNDGPGIHQFPHVLGDVNGDNRDDLVFIFNHWATGLFSTRVMFGLADGNFTGSAQASFSGETMIPDPDFETLIGRVNPEDDCADLVFPHRPDSDGDYRLRTFRAVCDGSGTAQWTRSTAVLP
jgi:hypothetical protein